MAAKLLKPVRTGDQHKSLSIKIPFTLSERLAALQLRASEADLTVDIDGQLSKALGRLVRAAETELGAREGQQGGDNGHQ